MTSATERWVRVKQLFTDALAQDPARRPAFLAAACDGDTGLQREVESLLVSHDQAGDRFEQPASGTAALAAAGFGPGHSLHLRAGARLGPYEILAPIGVGGMGEVYKARDTRLDRTVAIKILPPRIAADPEGRERFEREARAVAALSHPHICTLHDVGRDGETDFLVMEHLDGETLAARLVRGRLPLEQALDYACEIASALVKAHDAGIVHRDLKPGNIMLTRGGAKLLDFGLAKGFGPVVSGASPILQAGSPLTLPGRILGTLYYMAPEQLEGKNEDARTDLFAFGCVLHEMVTGHRAFDGGSSAAVVAAIMSARPTLVSELLPDAPPALEYIVDRCLAKDRDDRWQTARDLLADLKQTREALRGAKGPGAMRRQAIATRPPGSVRLAWTMAALAAAIAMAIGFAWRSSQPPQGSPLFLSILPPPDGFDLSPDPTVSPDGRHIAFKAQDPSHRTHIWLKTLGSSDARVIPGTEDTDYNFAPFWSPDSRSLGFFSRGRLKRVDIAGGSSQALAAAPEPRGGTWTSDGSILFNGDTQNLFIVQASGATPASLVAGRAGEVRLFPRALPDARHYLFTSRNVGGQGQGVYVGSLDSPDARRISDAWSPAAYANDHLLFVRQSSLYAQPFDLSNLTLTGEPHRLADRIGLGYGNPLTFAFSASATGGILTYWTGSKNPETRLTWFDRSGAVLATAGEPGSHFGFSLSADGRRVVLERIQASTSTIDLWLLDLANPVGSSRLTLDGRSSLPVWSPDGQRLLVMQRDVGLFLLPVAGTGGVPIAATPSAKWPADWSADGQFLAFTTTTPDGSQVWTTRADKNSQPVLYRQAPFVLATVQFSPDGRWLAYTSDESGRSEVYVDSYPTPRNKLRVSDGGGGWPRWRRDGHELFYLAPDRKVMVVAAQADANTMTVSAPRSLFEGPAVMPDGTRGQYAPNADGTRFLFNARIDDGRPVGLDVIANWPALLRVR